MAGIDITLTSSANTSGFDATAAAAGKTEWELKQMADAAKDAERAMSGTWGQKGTQDLDEMADAAKQVGPATEQAIPSVSRLGEQMGQMGKSANALGEDFERGASAGRVLASAMNGDAAALVNLAPAIKTIGTLLKTNIIGVLVTLGAVAASFAAPMIKGFLESKAAAEALRTASEAARKALAGVDETPLDKLNKALSTADATAKSFLATQNSLLETQSKIADNETELAKLRIQGDSKMSAQDKSAALAQLDAQTASRKAVQPVQKADLEYQAQTIALYEKQRALTAAKTSQEQAGIDNKLREYATGLEYWSRITDLQREVAAAGAKQALIPTQENVLTTQVLVKQYTDLVALGKVVGVGERDKYTKEGMDDLLKQKTEADAPVTSAQKAVTEQEQAARTALDNYMRVRDAQAAVAPSDKALADAGLAQAKAAAKAAPAADNQAEISALNKEAEDAAAAQDWSRQDAAVAKLRKLRQPAARPAAVTTYAPTDKAPAASQPGQGSDLAQPLNEAAQKMGDSATQSADSIQAAADAAAKVGEAAKPIDAAPLTSALQASATAQAAANSATSASLQQLVTLAQQQATLAQQLQADLSKTRSQVASLSQRVSQIAQSRAA